MLLVTYNIVQEGDFTFGVTALNTISTGLYRTNGNSKVIHTSTTYTPDDNIQGVSLETFYPINNNTSYTQERLYTYIESNVNEVKKPFLSTELNPLEEVSFRAVELRPFFTTGVADYHVENVCPSRMAVFTAMNLESPDYQTVNFHNIFQRVADNSFILYGESSLNLPYAPFHTVYNQVSMTKNFVSFVEPELLLKRAFPEDYGLSGISGSNTLEPNFSLFKSACIRGAGYQNIFSTYSIRTPASLKESKNSKEYQLRRSGLVGVVDVMVVDISTNEVGGDSISPFQHSLFEIATLNSNDTLQMIGPIFLNSTTATVNPFPSFNIFDSQFFIKRDTYCGADFFFSEITKKNVTIKVSGEPDYTYWNSLSVLQQDSINGTSSFEIGNGEYLVLANKCIGKREETFTEHDAIPFNNGQPAKNVVFTLPCYPSENLFIAANGGNDTRNYLKYANYIDNDHILLAGAKSINTIYPISNFGRTDAGSIHNQFTTYWNNNII